MVVQKGNALPPGVELMRDTFERSGPLEYSQTTPNPTHQWLGKPAGHSTERMTNLLHTEEGALRAYRVARLDRPANPAYHGPFVNIGPHLLVPGAKTTVRIKIRKIWRGKLAVAFGVHWADLSTQYSRHVSFGYDAGAGDGLYGQYRSGSSGSGGVVTYVDASAHPESGEWLAFTWEATGGNFSIYNESKGKTLLKGTFSVYSTTMYEGAGIAFYFDPFDSHYLWELEEMVVYSGQNRPDAGWIERGTVVEETAVVRKSAGTVVLELWESGSRLVLLGTYEVIADMVVTSSFDARLLVDRTGAGLELRVRGTAGSSFDIGAVQWDVRMVAVNATEISSGDSSTSSDATTLVVALVSNDMGTSGEAIQTFLDGPRVTKVNVDAATGVEVESLRTIWTARLPPDAILAGDGTGQVVSIQDDPTAADDSRVTANTDLRVSFPSPQGDLADVQVFRVRVRPT